MRRVMGVMAAAAMVAGLGAMAAAQAPLPAPSTSPYQVLNRFNVGGEGGWDYIYADPAGRRLYIPRGATRDVPATDTTPAVPAAVARITIFDLDTGKPLGEIPDTGGQGVAVCPNTANGFASSHPQVTMFDRKTATLIKKIDVGKAQADGIYCDPYNDRVYVFSHPTQDATVIDAKNGTVLGTIDLGGAPEQGTSDGKGRLYVDVQDKGSVAVVDVTAMKTIAQYSFGGNTGCNGLALDAKNQILFAACSRMGPAPARGEFTPPTPGAPPTTTMVILSAKDGHILAKLPLAGGSDGMQFNPKTMEAFSTGGNGTLTVVKEESPTKFTVEQVLETMNGARTIAFDSKTGHIFTMSQQNEPPPPPPPGAAPGRGRGRGRAVPGSFTILEIGK